MNDCLLGKWWIRVTDDRTVYSWIVESVHPGQIYPVGSRFTFIKVIIALHIVQDKEAGCGKAPEWACPRAVGIGVIGLINTPVVSGIPLKLSGLIDLGTKVAAAFIFGRTCVGIFDGVGVSAEINFMRSTIDSWCPV